MRTMRQTGNPSVIAGMITALGPRQMTLESEHTVSFICPDDPTGTGSSLSIFLEVSSVRDFSRKAVAINTEQDAIGFYVFDGSTWVQLTEFSNNRVPSDYHGHKVLYKFTRRNIYRGRTYYSRVKVSADGGDSWSEWTGDTAIW